MNNTFTIGSTEYKTGKIHAFKQFHIVRKMAPILKDLMPMASKLAKIQKSGGTMEDLSEDQMLESMAPIVEGISKLSDKDAEWVLVNLLTCVEVKQEHGNWAKLANENGMMFDNIELPVLLQAAGRAFMFNLSGFFTALPKASSQ